MKRFKILGVAALSIAFYWLMWGATSQKDLSRLSMGGWILYGVTTAGTVTTIIVCLALFCSSGE